MRIPPTIDFSDELRCQCGRVIPSNGYEKNRDGSLKVDSKGRPVWRKAPLLICESCVRAMFTIAKKTESVKCGDTERGGLFDDIPPVKIT